MIRIPVSATVVCSDGPCGESNRVIVPEAAGETVNVAAFAQNTQEGRCFVAVSVPFEEAIPLDASELDPDCCGVEGNEAAIFYSLTADQWR